MEENKLFLNNNKFIMKRKVLTIILTALMVMCIMPTYTASAASIEIKKDCFAAQDFVAPLPKAEWYKTIPLPEHNQVIAKHEELMDAVNAVPVTISVLKPIGSYFITAYCTCSKCCWPSTGMTASGTTCHYEDNPWVPTTCAIDRSIHHFGDTFYLKSEGRMYVAEDTGSAVKGKHIDIYFPDHSYVQRYGSHWETVYTVNYITYDSDFEVDFHSNDTIDLTYRLYHYRRPNTPIIQNFCPKVITLDKDLLNVGD